MRSLMTLRSASSVRPNRHVPAQISWCVRPLSSHAHKRTGDEEKLGSASHEEVNETGAMMTRWFKGLIIGWLGYKFYGIMSGSGKRQQLLCMCTFAPCPIFFLMLRHHQMTDLAFATDAETYLIAPSLKLLNSKQPSTREDGLYRIINWHGSDATLPAIVERDGVEALLNALPHVKAASRVAIIEMLQRMVPLGDAKARMLSQNAAERAATACAALDRTHTGGASLLVGGPSPDPAAAERCDKLAAALAQALQAAA